MTTIERLRMISQKTAFAPPPPPPGSVPMTDAAMAAGATPPPAGGMPMDPAAMGGMPPLPMDPAMAGGMPMDPAMMGGMPPPMDPAAMGGAPMDPMSQPIQMTAGDLMAFVQQMGGAPGAAEAPAGEPAPSGRVTNAQLMERMDALEQMLGTLLEGLGAADPGAMGGGMPPMDPAMMDPAMMGGAPMDPAMMDPAMMGGAPMDPAMMGGVPPDAMPKMASDIQASLDRLNALKKRLF